MNTIEILADLVAFDTTSATSNLALLDYIDGIVAPYGLTGIRDFAPEGDRANYVLRIGPDVEGGVVLCGHTDCVPVTGQPWDSDPFTLTQTGTRLYGRGTADMKGFLASVLANVPLMVDAPLTRPIILAFTYDEELGTKGGPAAAKAVKALMPHPSAVIIGEPTLMQVVTDHKGKYAYDIVIDGTDAHSSQPQNGANTVVAAARIATYIDDLAIQHRNAAKDPRFDPPYTSFNVAAITGGTAMNIIPRRTEMMWEYRPVPDDDTPAIGDDVARYVTESVLPELQRNTGIGEITITPRQPNVRALKREHDGFAESLARTLVGYSDAAQTVAFGTDGGHFQAEGFSTVVCGPGSIDQAHRPNEWIETSELGLQDAALKKLIGQLSNANG